MRTIIDTHVHVWDFEQARYSWLDNNTTILNRTYAIEELEHERIEAGISKGILVQAANNFEDTDWMLKTASANEWITGVVGWLPLMDPLAAHKALTGKYKSNYYFKGVRHLMHDEPDPKWLLQPAVLESLAMLADQQLPYDVVCIVPEHIRTVLKVAEKIPSLKIVFDHLSQPPIKTKQQFGEWGELMKQGSLHANVYTKISGLGTASGKPNEWTAADIRPYVEFVIDHYGEDRCFCGGDWPVSLLAGSYTRTWNAYIEILSGLPDKNAQEKIFYKNATLFYDC